MEIAVPSNSSGTNPLKFEFSKSTKLLFIILGFSIFSVFLTNLLSSDAAQTNSYVFFVIVPLVVVFFSLKLLRKHTLKSKESRIILLLVIYATLSSTAEITNVIYPIFFGVTPFPSLSDIFWISGNAFLLTFLFVYMKPLRNKIPRNIKIFSFVIATGFLIPAVIVGWTVNNDPNLSAKAIAISYPIYDAAFLYPTIIGLTVLYKKRNNSFLMLLFASILSTAAADTFYLVIYNSYQDGNPIDIGWIFEYIFLTFAVMQYRPLPREGGTISDSSLENKATKNVKASTTVNLLIPCLVIAVDLISSLIIISFYLGQPNIDVTEMRYLYVFFAVLGIFSAFMFVYNRYLRTLMKINTSDLEREKTSLEIMVEEEKLKRLSAIGSLSARLAHDLRNPLSVIKNSIDIMKIKNPETTENEKSTFDRIDRAITRMSHQIEEVLDYVSPKPLNATENSILDLLKSTVERIQRPNTINILLPQNDVKMSCDAEKLEIVFTNLLTNAVEAMKNHGVIKIGIAEKKGKVLISVHDTGGGIPDGVLPRVFEPLFTTKQTGTGLGLVSCKAIVEKHLGTIDVETMVGAGTTFTITLPTKYEPRP